MRALRSCMVLIALVAMSLSIKADPVKKAMALIGEGRYNEAEEALSKAMEKDPADVGLHFALSHLLSAEDNPGYELDQANEHILHCIQALPFDSADKRVKKWKASGVRPYTIRKQHNYINFLAWERAEQQHSVEGYQHFIDCYSSEKLVAKAVELRDILAYQQAVSVNTAAAFGEFLEGYPNAAQVAEARNTYELLLYRETTADSTVEAYRRYMALGSDKPHYQSAKVNYERLLYGSTIRKGDVDSYLDFIRNNPDNPYCGEAQDSVFHLSAPERQITNLYAFVRRHPSNRNYGKAWDLIYEKYTANDRPEDYVNFRKNYPDYPNMKMVEEEASRSGNHLVAFEQNGFYGYVDTMIKDSVIEAKFTEAAPFKGKLASVTTQNCYSECRYGYIDKEGVWVIPELYNYAGDFKDGFAIVGTGDCSTDNCKYGIINSNGDTIIPLIYDEVYEYSEGLAMVGDELLGYGYINETGKVRLPLQYEDALPFRQGLAPVRKSKAWYFINTSGEIQIDQTFEKAGQFSEGLAPVSIDGVKWGYINTDGELVIQPQFEFAKPFENGKASVLIRERDPGSKGRDVVNEYTINKEGSLLVGHRGN